MKCIAAVFFLCSFLSHSQSLHEKAYHKPDSVLDVLRQKSVVSFTRDEALAQGVALLKTYQYDSAIIALNAIKKRAYLNAKNEIELSYLLARCYYFKGEYPQAIGHILDAVDRAERMESEADIVFTKRFAGELYRASDNKDLAGKYLNEALKLAYSINDSLGIAYALNRLGVLAYQREDHQTADSLFQRSMPIAEALNNFNVIGMNLNDMGQLYDVIEDLNESLDLYKRALLLPLPLDMQINTKINLARVYLKMEEYKKGIVSAKQALDMANEAEILTLAVDAARVIADFYLFQNDFEQGIVYYRLYMNYRGRLFEEQKNAEILELETKYQTERNSFLVKTKDLELARQEAKIRGFLIGSIILVVLLIVIAYFYLRASRLQQELKTLNQTKDKLFAIVSHDLRNALTSFEGIGAVISTYVSRKQYDRVETIVDEFDKEAKQVHQLLDNLLNWSITQLKEAPFSPENLKLHALVVETCGLFEGLAAQKEIEIEMQVPEDLLVVADPNALSLIFRNFLSNAIKFSRPKSTIQVQAKPMDGSVKVTIADSGIGLTDEQMAKLKTSDYLESTTGTKGEQGTGLGLTLCLEYLKLHGSTLQVERNNPTGTLFTFDLPESH